MGLHGGSTHRKELAAQGLRPTAAGLDPAIQAAHCSVRLKLFRQHATRLSQRKRPRRDSDDPSAASSEDGSKYSEEVPGSGMHAWMAACSPADSPQSRQPFGVLQLACIPLHRSRINGLWLAIATGPAEEQYLSAAEDRRKESSARNHRSDRHHHAERPRSGQGSPKRSRATIRGRRPRGGPNADGPGRRRRRGRHRCQRALRRGRMIRT